MKSLSQYIQEAIKVRSTSKVNVQEYNYHPKTKHELNKLVRNLIKERGIKADLNDIDTSEINDMSSLFENSKFNGDISKWDVSKVEDMSSLFENSKFNGDISNWDVNNVKDMSKMFYNSPLEKNPPKWFKK